MKVIEAQHDEESGIDVAPLIDILFTLIIFLLLTPLRRRKRRPRFSSRAWAAPRSHPRAGR